MSMRTSYNVNNRVVQLYNMYKGNVGHDEQILHIIEIYLTNESKPREEKIVQPGILSSPRPHIQRGH